VCNRTHKWIRISDSNCIISSCLKTVTAVNRVSRIESRTVIAYVQKLDISKNSVCSSARKWIRISVSNCRRTKSRHVLKQTAVEPISGFDSRSVIAYVRKLDMSENSDCKVPLKWIRISDNSRISA
ncbi:hypothetical protein CEXT_729721, partial [Caerostris extrusa]